MERVWECKIGPTETLPAGSDGVLREAVAEAYQVLSGAPPEFVFSGLGGSLTEPERAVVEDREPAGGPPPNREDIMSLVHRYALARIVQNVSVPTKRQSESAVLVEMHERDRREVARLEREITEALTRAGLK